MSYKAASILNTTFKYKMIFFNSSNHLKSLVKMEVETEQENRTF